LKVSIIVAAASNGAIGKNNQLLWHLPADMAFFKQKTMGHHIIMGRKTYESIGKPLPGRTTLIITRNASFQAEGCTVVHSLEEAIEKAKADGETEAMVIGGADIYRQALKCADTIYLTEVSGTFEADTFFYIHSNDWEIQEKHQHTADDKNKFDYSFIILQKRK
jgi:dihydrofolate reductase